MEVEQEVRDLQRQQGQRPGSEAPTTTNLPGPAEQQKARDAGSEYSERPANAGPSKQHNQLAQGRQQRSHRHQLICAAGC
jgi:hypothetical protein